MNHEASEGAITLALGGIGIRGVLNIGLLQALAEADIPIKRIVATGISAMIAAHFALGRDPAEVLPRITRFFEDNRRSMWGIEQLDGLTTGGRRAAARSMSYFLRENLFCRSNVMRTAVFSWALVEDKLTKAFGGNTPHDLKIPLAVSVMDIARGKETLLSEGPIVDLVKAGIAFPGLFPPVKIDGKKYVSSATYCDVPLLSLSEDDRPVLAVRYPKRPEAWRPRSIIEVLARVDEIRGDALTQQILSKADQVIEPKISSNGSDWLSFRKMERAIPLVRKVCAEEISRWTA